MADSKGPDIVKIKTSKTYKGGHAGSGAVYGLGLLGALVYYIQQSDTFWLLVLGILKALVWPAFLIYYLLKLVRA
ncbi:MAG TPA: hypothetical protein VLE72_04420 [Candidatus Saccharimonadales bacterium]|nr:hypothetical protein [Candidatus Saccharimonadales bacterium]